MHVSTAWCPNLWPSYLQVFKLYIKTSSAWPVNAPAVQCCYLLPQCYYQFYLSETLPWYFQCLVHLWISCELYPTFLWNDLAKLCFQEISYIDCVTWGWSSTEGKPAQMSHKCRSQNDKQNMLTFLMRRAVEISVYKHSRVVFMLGGNSACCC